MAGGFLLLSGSWEIQASERVGPLVDLIYPAF